MIENEEQLRKAQSAVAYWRTMIGSGGGSWLGNENARTEILALHREIAGFERQSAREASTDTAPTDLPLSAPPPTT
jgi:hypothetical protein